MTQSVVERVARAILARRMGLEAFVSNGGDKAEFIGAVEKLWTEGTGNSAIDLHQISEYLADARAALAAMKEPSEGMAVVGGIKLENMLFAGDPECTGMIFDDIAVIYTAMIDAALKE